MRRVPEAELAQYLRRVTSTTSAVENRGSRSGGCTYLPEGIDPFEFRTWPSLEEVCCEFGEDELRELLGSGTAPGKVAFGLEELSRAAYGGRKRLKAVRKRQLVYGVNATGFVGAISDIDVIARCHTVAEKTLVA